MFVTNELPISKDNMGFIGLAPCPEKMGKYSFLEQIRKIDNDNLDSAALGYADSFQVEWEIIGEFNDRHILSGNLLINEPISNKYYPLNNKPINMT